MDEANQLLSIFVSSINTARNSSRNSSRGYKSASNKRDGDRDAEIRNSQSAIRNQR